MARVDTRPVVACTAETRAAVLGDDKYSSITITVPGQSQCQMIDPPR
jgi:hypothetical protein